MSPENPPDEIERWRDSNNRLREEMERQAQIAQNRWLLLNEAADIIQRHRASLLDAGLVPIVGTAQLLDDIANELAGAGVKTPCDESEGAPESAP